jgi:mannose-6-phosphate isomerase-like protein (cupin superfamily)
MKIDEKTANHYKWGKDCDGWHFLKGSDLSVIKERVPAGESEKRHFHKKARQFFLVLKGEAMIEIEGISTSLSVGQGIEVPPGQSDKFRNDSKDDVEFLVISSPTTHDDREDQE